LLELKIASGLTAPHRPLDLKVLAGCSQIGTSDVDDAGLPECRGVLSRSEDALVAGGWI
jgi:hypothetical protein